MPSLAQTVAIGAARTLLSFTPARDREQAEFDRDLREARDAFERFAALEAAHDPALVDLYADEGVVIERWFEDGYERTPREYQLSRYKELLIQSLSISRKANEHSQHRHVSYERVAPGWVVVRSQRDYTHSRARAPYQAVLHRGGDGRWRVTKEIATIVL